MTPDDDAGLVPALEGWVLLSTAAKELSISRQRVHILKKRFKTLRRLGDEGERPIYVVSRDELGQMKALGRTTHAAS